MRIPKGFIKEAGVYRRGDYIFDGKKIFKEATLLPTKEEQEDLTQTKFETLEDSIREALQYSSDIGQELRTKDIYIDKVKDGEFKITEKKSNKTVAIITPDNNVYELKFTEVPEQDDKSLAPNKNTAKAPKEQKDVETKPKELEDLKETDEIIYTKQVSCKDDAIMFPEYVSDYDAIIQFVKDYAPAGTKPQDCTVTHFDRPIHSGLNGDGTLIDKSEGLKEDENTKWKIEITVNGELTYYNRLVYKDIQEILSVANSISPTIEYESEKIDEATYDDDFAKEGKEEFPSEEPVAEEPTGDEVSEEQHEEVPEEKSVQPMDSAYFIRRPQNIEDLQNKIDRHLVNMATYQIVDEIELSEEEFNNYASNLRQDTKFLKSFRPNPTNADFTCIAVKSPDGTTLLVDNSGYDSAQYVSII